MRHGYKGAFEIAATVDYLFAFAATTASASQVRQPIYTSSVGKWRHHEQALQPLAGQLQAAGIDPG